MPQIAIFLNIDYALRKQDYYLIGMGTSSKFRTRVIEGIPRGSIEYSLNQIYF